MFQEELLFFSVIWLPLELLAKGVDERVSAQNMEARRSQPEY